MALSRNWKDEFRAMTNSERERDNSVMMSSVMPFRTVAVGTDAGALTCESLNSVGKLPAKGRQREDAGWSSKAGLTGLRPRLPERASSAICGRLWRFPIPAVRYDTMRPVAEARLLGLVHGDHPWRIHRHRRQFHMFPPGFIRAAFARISATRNQSRPTHGRGCCM
jgi:hypothetical protein